MGVYVLVTKKRLFELHGWAGIICFIPFILICLTGSLLVFKAEIDSVLLPNKSVVVPSSARLSEDRLIHLVNEQLPGYALGSWELLGENAEADRVYLVKKETNIWFKSYLNPYTGDVLSEPELLHHYFTDWLVQLHFTLLLNDIKGIDENLGTAFTSIFAILLVFLGVSGLIIYRRFWRRVFTLRLGFRSVVVVSDLHKLVGTLGSPVLLVLGITGGYYNVSIYIHEWQEHQQTPEHHIMTSSLYNSELSVTHMVKSASTHISGFKTTYILFPTEPNESIILFGQAPTVNPLLSDYGSTVNFHAQTGEYLGHYDIREQSFITILVDTFRKLHFGNFAGLFSMVVYATIGLSPILHGGTGIYLWYFRRRKRIHQRNSAKLTSLPRL